MRALTVITMLLLGACGSRAPEPSTAAAPETGAPTAPIPEFMADDPPERVRANVRCPNAAKEAGLSGSVILEFVVGLDGRAERSTIRVLHASDSVFVNAAGATVIAAVYRPGRLRGKPVRVIVRQPINFACRPD